jgi:hypothetical protein
VLVAVWFVLSGFLTAGIVHLRASETISDRVFQPLAIALCAGGERLETRYAWIASPGPPGRERPATARGRVPRLRAAECVEASGARRPARAFLVVLWLVVAALVAAPMPLLRKRKEETVRPRTTSGKPRRSR